MTIITGISYYYHYYISFVLEPHMNPRAIPYAGNELMANLVFINYYPVFLLGSFSAIIYYHLKKDGINIGKCSFTILNLTMCCSHVILIVILGILLVFYKISLTEVTATENLCLPFATLYAILLIFLTEKNFIRSILRTRVMIFFGDISYPGYLFHCLFAKLSIAYIENKIVAMIVSFFSTLLISFIVHKTIENYFVTFSKNICLAKNPDNTNKQNKSTKQNVVIDYVKLNVKDFEAVSNTEENPENYNNNNDNTINYINESKNSKYSDNNDNSIDNNYLNTSNVAKV